MLFARLPLRFPGDVWGIGFVLVVAIALFGPVLVSGQVWIDGDLGDFYWPTMLTAFAAIRQGEWPHWSPDMFGGFPLFADGSVGILFPLNWILLLFPNALMLIPLGRMVIAALGMYVFVRLLGIGPAGATLAGLVFSLNGFNASHFAHIDLLNGTALLPYTLMGAELSVRAQSRRRMLFWLMVAGLAHALAWVSFHPQAPLMILPVYGLWVVYRGFGVRRWRGLAWSALAVVGPVALALGLAAIQIIPMYFLGTFSPRQEWGTSFNGSFSLPPHNLIGLIWPGFIHSATGGVQWGLWNLETLVYWGTMPFVLMLIAGAAWPRQRHMLFFVVLTLLALWTALGYYLPFGPHYWLYSLPGYNVLRAPARFFFVMGFSGAYLAAVGLEWLLATSWTRWAQMRVAVAMGLLTALAVLIPIGAAYGLQWIQAHPQEAERLARVYYLDWPRIMPLHASDVITALKHKWAPDNTEMWETVTLLLVSCFLIAFWMRGWFEKKVFIVLSMTLISFNLIVLANRYVTSVPLARIVEPSPVVKYLDANLDEGRFYNAVHAESPPLSYLHFGIPDINGQSSLLMARPDAFRRQLWRGESALQDLACVQYVLLPTNTPDQRGWINTVGYRHDRPIVVVETDTPATLGTFIPPKQTVAMRELRLLLSLSNTVDVPQGEEVGELIVYSATGASQRTAIRAGIEASDIDARRSDVVGHIRHNPGAPVWVWNERDEAGSQQSKQLFYMQVALDAPRLNASIEKIEFRVIRPGSSLVVFGVSLYDPATNSVFSLRRYDLARYRLAYTDQETRVYANQTARPRAFLVGQAVSYASYRQTLERLLYANFDVSRRITIEGEVPAEAATLVVSGPSDRRVPLPPAPDPTTLGQVDIVDETSTRVTLRATTTAPAFLFLADTHYPRWEATVNGEPTPILLANYMFRAVYLPRGEHEVVFAYNPQGLRTGGLITLATFSLLGVLLVWTRRR